MLGIILGLIAVAIIWAAYKIDELGSLIVLSIIAILVVGCNQSDWWQAYAKEIEDTAAVERKAAATPHVIREADGCKVYAFSAEGREHYFTRCPANTVTEASYTQNCGKACTKVVVETIPTENK